MKPAAARWRFACTAFPILPIPGGICCPNWPRPGFRAVAPFTRGYAPTAVPDDGCYDIGALASDAGGLHEVLGGDEHAVLIGHDWGAEAAYAAAALAPDRWRRLVTLAVPPAVLDPVLFSDYEQLKRFFYIFLFRDTPGIAEEIVADGMTGQSTALASGPRLRSARKLI